MDLNTCNHTPGHLDQGSGSWLSRLLVFPMLSLSPSPSPSPSPAEVAETRKRQIRLLIQDFQEHERVSGTFHLHDDFYSLLRYILRDSPRLQDSLADLLPTDWCSTDKDKEHVVDKGTKENAFAGNVEDANEDEWAKCAEGEVAIDTLNAFLKFWSTPPHRLSPYSPALRILSHITEKQEQVSKPLLWAFCSAYWKHHYPPLKQSWIVPIVNRTAMHDLEAFSTTDIHNKLVHRLQKGKLSPFDASLELVELLQVTLPEEFVDEELGSLHRVLSEAIDPSATDKAVSMINAALIALEASHGCHCD
jgi:hypothetical protein